MKTKHYILFLTAIYFFLSSCGKYNIKWNLDKVPKKPVILSTGILNISNAAVTIEVLIENDSLTEIISRGICLSIEPNPDTSSIVSYQGVGAGQFIGVIDNLSPNTNYFIRSFALNSIGITYSDQISFKTTNLSGSTPTISTYNPNSITSNSAKIQAQIIDNGGVPVTLSGFCYSTQPNPDLQDSYTTDGSLNGMFESNLTNLLSNTTYYVRSYACNSVGTGYGNQVTFTTIESTAILVGMNDCSSLTSISSLYYGLNGTSAAWGISSTGYSGSCWSAPPPSSSGQLGTAIGYGHHVQFERNFQNQGYIEFWVNTFYGGSNNKIPSIFVNGNNIGNCVMIDGQWSSFYWMKVRSPIIPPGVNSIRIEFDGSYYQFNIDEINFFEY
jgi:hypothetical protein